MVAAEAFAVAEDTYCLDPTWHWWGRNEEGVALHMTPRGIPWTRVPLRLRRRWRPMPRQIEAAKPRFVAAAALLRGKGIRYREIFLHYLSERGNGPQ